LLNVLLQLANKNGIQNKKKKIFTKLRPVGGDVEQAVKSISKNVCLCKCLGTCGLGQETVYSGRIVDHTLRRHFYVKGLVTWAVRNLPATEPCVVINEDGCTWLELIDNGWSSSENMLALLLKTGPFEGLR
jgi:hypothetical protein